MLTMVAVGLVAAAQTSDDPVLVEINGKQIRQSEFMKEFLASIGKDPSAPKTACTFEKRQALEEYVELFVNFRTKLADAYAKGYDTLPALKRELSQYRGELASPYLVDSASLAEILREAYERNHYAIRAAHILVRVDKNASPADTLKAYNKAMSYYKRAKAGENFNDLSWEEELWTKNRGVIDPDAPKRNPKAGELGYFTVFDMIYPFENAAYALKDGEISKPVRTRFGYHIIKVYEKVPYYGESVLQHVWVRGDKEDTKAVAKKKIDEAYSRLQGGESFELIAKNFSDDFNTSQTGGTLPPLGARQIPEEYVQRIAGGLAEGSYSEPFETQYGWHILKLVKKDQIPAYEDMVPSYKQKLTRDQRNTKPKTKFMEDMKAKYHFMDYTQEFEKDKKGKKTKTAKASLDPVLAQINDSVFSRRWNYNDSQLSGYGPLFALDGKNYTLSDFAKYIKDNQVVEPVRNYSEFVNARYKEYVDGMVMNYADQRLEEDNAEFAELISEYRNGLMIFAYNDDSIWSRAIRDSAGLDVFYARESAKKDLNNPDDSNYFWNDRARTMVISVADSMSLASAQALKIVSKGVKKGWVQSQFKDALMKKIGKKSTEEHPVETKMEVYEWGHQKALSKAEWKVGTYVHPEGKGYKVLVVESIRYPELKSRQEARGYYITDYQNELETLLNQTLREKYKVKLYQNVVDEITY